MYIKKLFVAFRSIVNPRLAYKSLGKVLKPLFPIKLHPAKNDWSLFYLSENMIFSESRILFDSKDFLLNSAEQISYHSITDHCQILAKARHDLRFKSLSGGKKCFEQLYFGMLR